MIKGSINQETANFAFSGINLKERRKLCQSVLSVIEKLPR